MRSSTIDRLWYGGAAALVAAGVVGGAALVGWDLRQQNLDHSYAVGYDEGRRGMYDETCRYLVDIRWPRRYAPETDMGAWLEGCLVAAEDGAAPTRDPSAPFGPPG